MNDLVYIYCIKVAMLDRFIQIFHQFTGNMTKICEIGEKIWLNIAKMLFYVKKENKLEIYVWKYESKTCFCAYSITEL